jgi:uncharacterized protein (TIGR02001 family)
MRLVGVALPALMWASSGAAADVSGGVGVVSDYRYRGVTLSHGRPALQGSLMIEHSSGLYGEVWTSTLERPGDPTDSEIDLSGGYEKELSEHFSIDVSGTYFAYPSASSDNYFEATAMITATRGNALLSAGASYVPRQRATGHANNAYLFGAAEFAVPKTWVTLKTGIGYERGAFDEVARGGKWDWTIGGEVALKPAKVGLSYVGSNADGGDRHALVASVFVAW